MENKLTVIQKGFYAPIKADFLKATDEKKFKKEINFAIQILKNNQYLQTCEPQSILDAVLNVSLTSLTLNPVLGYAYLVPHKKKCVLYPGYQGLIHLATEKGAVKAIEIQLIYQGDDIILDLASPEKVVKHIPYLLNDKEQGKTIGGYSIATLADGIKHVEVMSEKQILDVRKYSESYKAYKAGKIKTCIWVDDVGRGEMYRKTILKRHFKYLPKSGNESLHKAIELDNADFDFPMTFEQGNYIESLLLGASLPEKEERDIYNAIHDGNMTNKRAKDCIEFLLENQTEPIEAGKIYQQRDISKKLKEIAGDNRIKNPL